ncbi:alpha-(1-_3)-arabinofuranosyltransferase [Tsukamurella sp. 8F]|uniref:alpha-(1->3)-arabinofuranosyltransferase n=1 Tax=unclassified Tsukamurella TaxID=2633480 RepID=UPI0023B9D097|nr:MULTISPECIES: alpha-(1->3)-arabinofuranosyltransferase [unclassified Tsukamurella]MDF0529881.1 alpha-(1->3)-arabinofuranosyltransferase [Tsukamurella sp. 8J]MDF0588664.1 alpha-(1->3)-arabinofuranosyltransferase [Tsukamurella sp. 8F]
MPTSSTAAPAAPLSRRFAAYAYLIIAALVLLTAPGRVTADTKVDLTANPLGFLSRAANVWSSQSPLGQVQNQAYGYFFPHGAFFAAAHLAHIPAWLTQRLWWSLLLFAGFWGVIRLAEALRTGSRGSRVVAAGAFALSPYVLTTLGAISSETTPVMLAPWVLIPVIRMLSGENGRSLRVLAAQSAAAVALMGAVNAVATGLACLVTAIWWAVHSRSALQADRRRYLVFTAWWLACLLLATLWWIVPLLVLGRVSPPFLDFIESSRATTEWTSLPEVLRGTDSWSPFISSERFAGAMLATTPAAVITTGLVAGAGVAGLAMRRMPHRGVWITILIVGLVGMGAGYAGGMGSPFAEPVRVFLDAGGAPLRNVYKLEPLVRLPLALGIAHLLARAPLPGTVSPGRARAAFAHPERNRLAAAAIAVIAVIALSGGLAWTGRLAPRGSYDKIPDYWSQAAGWLSGHAEGTAPGQARAERALVVPGAPFGAQIWGLTRDEPLQPLATTPWAVRDAIPLNPPGAIRALDSVQRLFADGTPAPGLAPTLLQQGVHYVVLRADLDPDTSRSARPALAKYALDHSPGLSPVATFGPATAPDTVKGVVIDSGLRPPMPAITIYKVAAAGEPPAGPYLADLSSMPRVAGGPESLLTLQNETARAGRRPLGPAVLTGDARGLPPAPVTVTDTPKDAETDFGRVDDHTSAIRADGDPRRTLNRALDYPVTGVPPTEGRWIGGRVETSSSASDATQLGSVMPGASPAAAVDGDPDTSWVSAGLDRAVGQWLQIDLDHPHPNLAAKITLGRALGPAVTRVLVSTQAGSVYSDPVRAGQPITVTLPSAATGWVRITAADTSTHRWGDQFALAEVALTDTETGRPVEVRHEVAVPRPTGPVGRWVFGQDDMGRTGCVPVPARRGATSVQCADISLTPQEPGTFARDIVAPAAQSLIPSLTLRARPGKALSALLADGGHLSSTGDSASSDTRGAGYAATDGDPSTSWTAPQSSTDAASAKPVLHVRLPSPALVGGLQLKLPAGLAPAHPTKVGIDLGTGRQVRKVHDGVIELDPGYTSEITITVLDWDDALNINALGFPEKMPPGIAEVTVVGKDGKPVATPADPDRPVTVACDDGPVLDVGGKPTRFRIDTTARALRYGDPVHATACSPAPVALPEGAAQVAVHPGAAFSVQTLTLDDAAPPASDAAETNSMTTPVTVESWTADRRRVAVGPSPADRVLVVPESVNPGWAATGPDGTPLRSVTVNGWQQGWVVPAGTAGTVTLRFALNVPYRIGLFGGLTLLVVLAALVIAPGARRPGGPAITAASSPYLASAGIAAAAFLLSGWLGLAVAGLCGVGVWALRAGRRASGQAPVVVGAAGLTAASTVVLARGPWHDSHGYLGHSALPQALALAGICVLACSAVPAARAVGRTSRRFARRSSQRASAKRAGSSTKE